MATLWQRSRCYRTLTIFGHVLVRMILITFDNFERVREEIETFFFTCYFVGASGGRFGPHMTTTVRILSP